MRISGFTFVRNAVQLDYPLRESLRSLLPLVDELVVAHARDGADDGTARELAAIGDARVRVVDVPWNLERRQLAYSDATNAALAACGGDWCVYLQADEVLHEDEVGPLRARMEELLGDARVEGLLFDYLHFFGDFHHVQRGQGWYQSEIRAVRNGLGVRSVRDAQSFRRADGGRLTVARAGATVFHYGWVRHPARMQTKTRDFWSHRLRSTEVDRVVGRAVAFDYGPLGRLPVWTGDHPAVMRERIEGMDWSHLLREVDPPGARAARALHRDERLLYRALTGLARLTGIDFNHKNHGWVLKV